VFYKLLGMLTWKAIRFYVRNKVPAKPLYALLVVLGIGAVTVAAKARGTSE
jgi:hypothetical protein